MPLAQQFFSGITYPIVGIVMALLLFDGLKEGVLLPVFNGIYRSDRIHDTTITYEDSGALVVVRGPFVFRIGYMVSRILLFLLLLLVALPCMWHWRRHGGTLRPADPSADSGGDIDLDIDNIADTLTEAATASVAGQAKVAAAMPAVHAHLVA
jgi:hypothetical protein